MKNYYKYWGKTNRKESDEIEIHLLPYHLLDVAACGQVLLEKSPRLLKYFATEMQMTEDDTKRFLVFMLALHDIGKFSHRFQNLSEGAMGALGQIYREVCYAPRHDTAGDVAWTTFLRPLLVNWFGMEELRRGIENLSPISRAFFGHHGTPPLPVEDPEIFEVREDLISFVGDCVDLFGIKNLVWPHFDASLRKKINKVAWTMAGYSVAADWFGSNSETFFLKSETEPLTDYWADALKNAKKIVSKSGVLPERCRPNLTFSTLFPKIVTPRPMQQFVNDVDIGRSPYLFIIEDATGSGKTEAAITLAGRLMANKLADGLFFGLPTKATANQMFGRVSNFYRKLYDEDAEPSVILAHGSRKLNDTFKGIRFGNREANPDEGKEAEPSEALCRAWVSNSNRTALLASVGVGTIDQAMLSCLHVKFQSLRLYGLFGKVLIVDEIHAYDAYMNKIIQSLICFHASRGGSVILLSATLPTDLRRDLIHSFCLGQDIEPPQIERQAYPLVSVVSNALDKKCDVQNIEPVEGRNIEHRIILTEDINEVLDAITQASREGKCVCWIRNTVAEAIETFELLSEGGEKDNVFLFHARFALCDRQRIEKEIFDGFGPKSDSTFRKGKIVIATQVIEQSLDVDFDLLVTDLAPIEMIIQRAGRQHRHKRCKNGDLKPRGPDERDEPELIIFGPNYVTDPQKTWHKDFSRGSSYVYSNTKVIYKTAEILSAKKYLSIPNDSRELVEDVYGGLDKIPENIIEASKDHDGKERAEKGFADFAILNWSEGYKHGDHWSEDIRFTSRLGDPTETIRIARWEGKVLEPYAQSGSDYYENWMLSDLQYRFGWYEDNITLTAKEAKAIGKLKEKLKDGEYVRFLVEGEFYDGVRGLQTKKT